jgi:hypothetical protein
MSIGTPVFSVAGTVLTAMAVAWLLANAIAGPRAYRRLSAAEGRLNLIRFYTTNLVFGWLGVALVFAVLATSPGLTAGQLGLALPSGEFAWLAVGTAFYVVVMAVIGRFRTMRRYACGKPIRAPRSVAALLPRTGPERRLAVGVAITAGISEELMFRGLLIAAGVGLAGLSVPWSIVVAAVVFALAHLYQGPSFIVPALIGLSLTVLYVISGSLLPGIVAHTALDVAALTIPAHVVRRPAPEPGRGMPEPVPAPDPSTLTASDRSAPSTVSQPAQVRPPFPMPRP